MNGEPPPSPTPLHGPTVLLFRLAFGGAVATTLLLPLLPPGAGVSPRAGVAAVLAVTALGAHGRLRRAPTVPLGAASGVLGLFVVARGPDLPTGAALVVAGAAVVSLGLGHLRLARAGGSALLLSGAASLALAGLRAFGGDASAATGPHGPALLACALGVALLTGAPRRGVLEVLTARTIVGDSLRFTLVPVLLLPLVACVAALQADHRGWLSLPTGAGVAAIALALLGAAFIPLVANRAHAAERAGAELRREIHAARDRYRALLDSRPEDAAFLLDGNGTLIAWSNAGERVTGHREADVLGRGVELLYPQDARERGEPGRDLREAGRTGRHAAEGTMRRKDGAPIRATLAITALRDPAGVISGYAGALRDVTQQRRAEAEDRRREHASAQVLAEAEANRRKSQMISGIAHDLRAPLWAIEGIGELLQDRIPGPLTDLQAELITELLRAGGHLRRLVDGVLDLALADTGDIEFHPTQVDVAGVVEECVGALRPAAMRQGITLTAEPVSVGAVCIDSTRFRQVVYNYLSNAVKFTPAGGSVTARLRTGPPGTFRFEVQDTGPGIATPELLRLFVEFPRLGTSPSAGDRGTGLGLALVRRIVELQGGRVGVHAAPGGGAVFFAVLPRQPIPTPTGAAGPPGGDHVLLVDAPPAAERIRQDLERQGLRVQVAASGEEAIQIAATGQFGALIVELVLPDMTGIDLARSLRTRIHPLGVVLLTASPDVPAAPVADVRAILRKPIDAAQLGSIVRQMGLPLSPAEAE